MCPEVDFRIYVCWSMNGCAQRLIAHLSDDEESPFGSGNEMLLPVGPKLCRKGRQGNREIRHRGSGAVVKDLDFCHALGNVRQLPSGRAPCIQQHKGEDCPRCDAD